MDNEEQIEVTTELESEPRFFRYSRANGQVQMFLNVDHILFVTFTVGGEAKITMSNGADFTVAPSNPEYEKLWDYLNE